jgi:hypothetical protein
MEKAKKSTQFSVNWVLVLGLLATLTLAACGDTTTTPSSETPGRTGGSNSLASRPVLQLADCSQLASTTPLATATPGATASTGNRVEVPTGFKLFVSSVYPYALSYPEKWDLQANQSRNDVKGDFFVALNKDNKTVFVTVTGRKLPDGVTDLPGFFKTLDKDFAGQSITYQREADRKVGNADAYVVAFNTDQPGFQVQTLQIIFVAQNQAWNISYNSSYDQPLSYCADFTRMLDSFTFSGLIK